MRYIDIETGAAEHHESQLTQLRTNVVPDIEPATVAPTLISDLVQIEAEIMALEAKRAKTLVEIEGDKKILGAVAQVLGDLKVEDAFRAVRDDVWREGRLKRTNLATSFDTSITGERIIHEQGGLTLVSEPSEVINPSEQGWYFALYYYPDQETELTATVSFPIDKAGDCDLASPMLGLTSKGRAYVAPLKPVDLAADVREKGLVYTFHQLFKPVEPPAVDKTEIDPNAANAQGQFFALLDAHIKSRFSESQDTATISMLPGPFRGRTKSVIDQFPDLRNQRKLSRFKLLNFESGAIGQILFLTLAASLFERHKLVEQARAEA